jgi:hypothetical protein
MSRGAAAVVASGVATLWSTPGWAHTVDRAFPPPPLATPATPGLAAGPDPWAVAAVAAIALVILAARRRKSLGAALVVLTLWVASQAAVHSVHHLGQPSDEGRCAVASTTAHGSAIPSEIGACAGTIVAQAGIARDLEPAVQPLGPAPTHEGRAPPRLSL